MGTAPKFTAFYEDPEPTGKVGDLLALRLSLDRVRALSLDLARGVEKLSPGDHRGLWRHEHMQDAALGAVAAQREFRLSPHDTALLEIILSAHDLGRFREFHIKRLGKSTINHGIYSAQLLIEYKALEGLAAEDKQVVLQAVRWHGEREVDLPEGRSKFFCYLLRDEDKLEIFSHGKRYSSAFALDELLTFLPFSDREKLIVQGDRGFYEGVVAASLDSGGERKLNALQKSDPVANKIHSLLSAKLEPDNEAAVAILEQRSADASKTRESFVAFLATHIAMIFDLKSPKAFQRVVREELLEFELNFVRERCDAALFEKIRASFRSFIWEHTQH